MGVIGIKQAPRPTISYSFFMKIDEEGLLKVSIKNFHPYQNYPFFKNAVFSKIEIFLCILGNHLIGLFNHILN